MSGTVTDVSNTVIPGAGVTLTNVDTHAQRVTKGDCVGNYVFSEVVPGAYNLEVKAAGFEARQITGLQLLVNSPATVDVKLNVGSTKQQVTVNANAQLLNPTDASLGNAIGTTVIMQLPMLGVNPVNA